MRIAVVTALAVSLVGHALSPFPAIAAESVRKVLAFDSSLNGIVLPAKNAPTLLAPSQCRAIDYTAGAGEVAVVSVSGTLSPSLPSNHDVQLVVTRSVPLSLPVAVSATEQSESMGDGTASISAKARIPLNDGFNYQFGAGFSADQETTISTLGCQGVVIATSIGHDAVMSKQRVKQTLRPRIGERETVLHRGIGCGLGSRPVVRRRRFTQSAENAVALACC